MAMVAAVWEVSRKLPTDLSLSRHLFAWWWCLCLTLLIRMLVVDDDLHNPGVSRRFKATSWPWQVD
jgi:hypothetical protein